MKLFTLSFVLFSAITQLNAVVAPNVGLQSLMDGNARYVKHQLTHPNMGFEARAEATQGQDPYAIILGCADSRVPPEIIFDQGIGDLFVVRVAGNILGASEFDSLLFAIKNFSSSVVLILGHKGCGAVNAVVNGRGSDLQAIGKMIEPAVAQAKKESKNNVLDRAIELNVEHMVDQLKAVPFIKAAITQQKLQVVGGVYDLQTGKVNLLK